MENTHIKVFFKRCSPNDKKRFRQAKCIMPISVGIMVHEGEKFLATMQLVNQHFQSCVLLIDDSIQRYTMQIDEPHCSLDTLYIKAVSIGDQWLQRNRSIYETLTIPYKILRWDDWRNHKEFQHFYNKVENLYSHDELYKKAIYKNIDDFLKRYVVRSSQKNFDKKHAIECCLQYLKEECAVMCLWALEGFDFEVYPSSRNKAMACTYKKIIQPMFPNLLKSISLYFETT